MRTVALGHDKEVAVNRSITIAVLALAALGLVTSDGAAEMGLQAIEGRVGFVSPENDIGSTFLLGAAADLGTLTPEIRLEGGIEFWRKSYDLAWGYSADQEVSLTNIAFQLGGRYDIQSGGNFLPFAFAGLGLHMFRGSYSCSDCVPVYNGFTISGYEDYDESESEMEVGFYLGAGGEFGSGSGMRPTARVGYNINGGADYFFVMGGLRFPMGN